MARARKMFRAGQSLDRIRAATNLSDYVLSLLAVPERELKKIVEADAAREQRASTAATIKLRRGR
jgi:hypothetical protein